MTETSRWHEANQQYLMEAIAQVQDMLSQAATADALSPALGERPEFQLSTAEPALETLCQRLGLSAFERSILLLCAGMEISSLMGSLCGQWQGTPSGTPTFGMALSVLPGVHWSAMLPEGPLRYWKLIELLPGAELTQCALRIDERILHYLIGQQSLDERLQGTATLVDSAPDLPPSHQQIAQQMTQHRGQQKPL